MRKPIHLIAAFLFFSNYLSAQNSMVGDGFGGRSWYQAHNYQVGSYSGFTVCGDSNQLYSWGINRSGELGNGIVGGSFITPQMVIGMSNIKFYTTGYISAAIKNDNTAWAWGYYFPSTPVQILTNTKFVDGGLSHVVFVKNDGTVWGAGGNASGELGNGSFLQSGVSSPPVQMTGVFNAVRAIAVGGSDIPAATIILLSDGSVKITGGGGWFQTTISAIPVTTPLLNNIVDIKGNTLGAYALDSSGNVYSFGRDNIYNPVLGLGFSTTSVVSPSIVTFPNGASPIVALSSNNDGYFCLALDSNKNVYAWGNNFAGQLGDGTFNAIPLPKLVATGVVDIFAGETFSYILKADSTLWATGGDPFTGGSIWMNLPNIQRNVFTQIDPTIAPMNLCAPKVWGVVPIKLANFTCIANGNTAYLNWQSAEETNASKYIVQYRHDGSSFKDIASVFATGANSKYNYTHQQISGTAFYRLQMIDKDGSFTYSEIRVVKFDNKTGFTIAPNPANDVVYVFTKNNAVIKSIQIISVDGQVVKTISNYDNGQGITISNLAKAVYILKVVYNNYEMECRRLIKR